MPRSGPSVTQPNSAHEWPIGRLDHSAPPTAVAIHSGTDRGSRRPDVFMTSDNRATPADTSSASPSTSSSGRGAGGDERDRPGESCKDQHHLAEIHVVALSVESPCRAKPPPTLRSHLLTKS